MINFIRLTSQYSGEVVVNINKIVRINDDKENEKIIGSRLTFSDGQVVFVDETMDEILNKIKGE